MIRRIIVAGILVYLHENRPGVQILVMTLTNFLSLIYVTSKRRKLTVRAHKIECFNEFCLYLSTLHLYFYSDGFLSYSNYLKLSTQLQVREISGYSLITLVLLKLAVNSVIVLKETLEEIFNKFKYACQKIRGKCFGTAEDRKGEDYKTVEEGGDMKETG